MKKIENEKTRKRENENSDVAALKGKVIRLKFHLRNARLYAFQVVKGYVNFNK